MGRKLDRGFMRRVQGRAGELELSARLERNGRPALPVVEADQLAGVLDPLPAERGVDPLEQRPDAPLARVGDRGEAVAEKEHLLVLRADPELAGRLAPFFEPGGERVTRFDDVSVDDVASHKAFSPLRPASRRTAAR